MNEVWNLSTIYNGFDDPHFVFLLSANHGQLYDKAHLSGGSAEQFRDFISGKTGKSVIYIK